MLRFIPSFLLAAACVPLAAQETKPPVRQPGDVEVHFANGSTVKMNVQNDAIEVRTLYGVLKVPLKDIKQIDFGVHFSDEIEKKIDEAIGKLNSENFRDREAATNTLIKLGADAYPAVHEIANSATDLELSKRAKAVLQTMSQTLAAKDLRLQRNDTIVTPTFTIAGRITTPTIKAKADYFGTVELQVAQLRTMKIFGDLPAEITVAVDAAKYAMQGNTEWLATDFTVDSRMRLSISASGQVNLRPNIPGAGLECGPTGYPPAAAGFGVKTTTRRPGALLGKIGENGPTFVVGDHYEQVPGRDGKLFLQIVPSPYGPESTGSYQVKISAKP